MYTRFFKRVIDIAISFVFFVLTLPILILTAIALYFHFLANPFFIQVRPGKDQVLFRLIKFKTMKGTKDDKGNLLPDEMRITKLGRLIRNGSIDELPQLINVMKGNMSFVGPRPLLKEYLPLYNSRQAMRHKVRPGITGWAQVNGRNNLSWEEKFEYDSWYVENLSFELDIKIILRTIKKVMKREGINSGSAATMERFLGSH